MCDLNDPEVIESLRYLLVTREEKIRLSSLPFNAKTAVFVGDKTDGFIEGEITGNNTNYVILPIPERDDLNLYKISSTE